MRRPGASLLRRLKLMSRPISRHAPALLIALFALLSTFYSIVVPPFEAPDEIWHMAVVQYIAEGKGLPVASAQYAGIVAPAGHPGAAVLPGRGRARPSGSIRATSPRSTRAPIRTRPSAGPRPRSTAIIRFILRANAGPGGAASWRCISRASGPSRWACWASGRSIARWRCCSHASWRCWARPRWRSCRSTSS